MPTKPTVSVEWAIAAAALKTVPSTDQKNRGWDTSDGTVTGTAPEPIMQNQNGWMNNAYQWINWLDIITTPANDVREIAAITFPFATTDVNIADDEITEVGHGLLTGDVWQGTTTGTLPAGLSLATDYWTIYVTDDIIKPASSLANAIAGTAVDITDVGTGTHTLTSTNEWSILDDDGFNKYNFTTGSATHTLVFPLLPSNLGRSIKSRKSDSGSGVVIMDGDAATINNQATIQITKQYEESNIDAGSSEWYADYQSQVVTLDGGYTGGTRDLMVVRDKNNINITCNGLPSHTGGFTIVSTTGLIPVWARPVTTHAYNCYFGTSVIASASVKTTGQFETQYSASRGDTLEPPNIPYSLI